MIDHVVDKLDALTSTSTNNKTVHFVNVITDKADGPVTADLLYSAIPQTPLVINHVLNTQCGQLEWNKEVARKMPVLFDILRRFQEGRRKNKYKKLLPYIQNKNTKCSVTKVTKNQIQNVECSVPVANMYPVQREEDFNFNKIRRVFAVYYNTFNIMKQLLTDSTTETGDGRVVGAVASLPTGGNLPVVVLKVNSAYPIQFLVDTGASRSLMRKEYASIFGLDQTETGELVAANNTAIEVIGTTNLNIQIADKQYPFNFVLADTTSNILGFDFIKQYGVALIVDKNGFQMKPTLGGIDNYTLANSIGAVTMQPYLGDEQVVQYKPISQPHLNRDEQTIIITRW